MRSFTKSSTPRLFLIVPLVAVLLLAAIPAAADTLTPTDVLQMKQVSSAAISHDGRLAAYTVGVPRKADEENGGDWNRLYLIDLESGESRPFITGSVNVSGPAFSPDDRYVAFRTKRGDDEHSQIWVIPVGGGEARRATDARSSVSSFAWSPDGSALAYIASDPATKREKKLKKKGYLPEFYEENLKMRNVYLAPFAFGEEPGEARQLTHDVAVWQMKFSPDGKGLALGISEKPLTDQRYMFQRIWLLDLADDSLTRLVDNPGKLGGFSFSPDSKYLAYTAAVTRADHAASHGFVVETASGKIHPLTPPRFEGHFSSVSWSDKNEVQYLAGESVWNTLSRLEVGQDPAKRKVVLHGKDIDLVFGSPQSWPGLKTAVFTAHSTKHARELFVWHEGAKSPQRLTDLNPCLHEVDLAEQRVVRWPARDGLVIEGLLTLPLGHDDKPFPLLVEVHGGPEAHRSQGWLTRYASLGQVAAAEGYGVLVPNYRGSTGRGLDFAMSSHGDPAGKEYDDIADGIRHLIDEGLVDGDRVGLYGGSYGGYAACWFGTYYTDLVKAVSSFVGITDLVSKRFLTDIPYEDEYVHMGAPVRDSWELMRERSPITYASQSRTAMLILHGKNDTRVHPSQSQEMYRSLKMSGHPATRLVYYPGEGHGNRKRAGRWDAMHRILAWMNWYVRDLKPLDGPMPPLDVADQFGMDWDDEKETEK